MHSIRSGLKALEAVSCCAFVSRSLPSVLLLSVIMFSSSAEMGSRARCLNASNVPRSATQKATCHVFCHTRTRALQHKYAPPSSKKAQVKLIVMKHASASETDQSHASRLVLPASGAALPAEQDEGTRG